MEGEVVSMQEIFTLERRGVDDEGNVLAEIVPTGIRPRFGDRLKMSGIKLPMSMFDRYSD
jgi:pilus assembly protein CpaF